MMTVKRGKFGEEPEHHWFVRYSYDDAGNSTGCYADCVAVVRRTPRRVYLQKHETRFTGAIHGFIKADDFAATAEIALQREFIFWARRARDTRELAAFHESKAAACDAALRGCG